MKTLKYIILVAGIIFAGNARAQYVSDDFFDGMYTEEEEEENINFSFGYINKSWETDFGDYKYKENLWGEPDKRLHGIQFGFGYTPHTRFGLGIQTGIYGEVCFSYSEAVKEQYGYDHYDEVSLYVPAHVAWTIPFSRKSSLTAFGGVGVNWAIYGQFQDDEYVYDYWRDQFVNIGDYSYQFTYGRNGWPKHFNLQAEFGATLRLDDFFIKATFSRGLSDHEFYFKDGYKTRQNKFGLGIGLTI